MPMLTMVDMGTEDMAMAILIHMDMDVAFMARGQLMRMLMPTMVPMAMEDMSMGLLMAMDTGAGITMARGQLMRVLTMVAMGIPMVFLEGTLMSPGRMVIMGT